MANPIKQVAKMNITTEAADVALVKRLKKDMLPEIGKLTNTALVRIALRNLAEKRGVKA